MLGLVFTAFSDFVIDNYGLTFWNEILSNSDTESKGVFTKASKYKDEDLIRLLTTISKKLDKEPEVLLQIFGGYLFTKLIDKPPLVISEITNLFEFLKILDPVIHKEVKRLYSNSYLPLFQSYERGNDLELHYQSKRKLCDLAIGLIKGAAHHFKEDIVIDQLSCQKTDSSHCVFYIKKLKNE